MILKEGTHDMAGLAADDGTDADGTEIGDGEHGADVLIATARNGSIDTARSDPIMTDRDDDHHTHTGSNAKAPRRKGAKGINHFSFCDRATQTTIPPVRVFSICLCHLLCIFFPKQLICFVFFLRSKACKQKPHHECHLDH